MKALVLCAFAVALVGCEAPETAAPAKSTDSAQIILPGPRPTQPPPNCVNETWFFPTAHDPGDNPWAGVAPGFVVYSPYEGRFQQVGYIVYGFDSTLNKLVWYRNVLTSDDVDFYTNHDGTAVPKTMPDTLPFNCPTMSDEMGQIGSVDVPGSDGGNTPQIWACADASSLATKRTSCLCQPNPDPCGSAECGTASDGCGLTYECGTCTGGFVCNFGSCVSRRPPPPVKCNPECI